MVGGLKPEERLWLIQNFGAPEHAIDELREREPDEYYAIWETQGQWPKKSEFWVVFWKWGLPVLGYPGVDHAVEKVPGEELAEKRERTRSTRRSQLKPQEDGRRKAVSHEQLKRAAKAYRQTRSLRAIEKYSGLSRSGRGKVVKQNMDLGLYDWDKDADRLVFHREIPAAPSGGYLLPTLAEAAALLKSRR
jgi:hypothetical protein